MLEIRKVLAVLNEFESMDLVLKKGMALAAKESAFLEVMFVHETPIFDRVEYFRFKEEPPLQEIDPEKVRQEIVKKLADIGAPETTLVEIFLDDTVDQVLEATKREKAMLILIAHHNSIAKKLAKESRLPVLVFKREDASAYENIVVPFDFSEASKVGVDLALKLFDKESITLVHDFRYVVMKGYADPEGLVLPYIDMEISDVEQKVQEEELQAYAKEKGVRSRLIVQKGSVAEDLIKDIENNNVDLVVSGSEDANRLFSRSVALELLSDAPADVLVYAPKI